MVRNRLISFEVSALRDGRWTIEAVLENEAAALLNARQRLSDGRADEVKVVRLRAMPDGFTTRTEVLAERRSAGAGRPIVVTGPVDAAPPCETLDDLYGLSGRRLMARLLRRFVETYQVTPTEILHNWTWARKLSDTGNLVQGAIHQVAAAQVARTGGDLRERVAAVERLVAQAMVRARDFAAAQHRLPRFDAGGPAEASRRILGAARPDDVPDDAYDFTFLALLSVHLLRANSLVARQEIVLDMIGEDPDPGSDSRLVRLLEGVVADTLGSADMVKDLLGPHPHLGASLVSLADLVRGRADAAGPTPALVRIGRLIGSGRGEACRAVLLDRLLAELGRDTPLDRRDPGQDDVLLDRIVENMRDDAGGLIGGAGAEAAISRRRLRRQQAVLRGLGLVEQADQLPAHWPPA
ncbi:MAG TPA: hypothetical protein VK943_03295 [Arenibaculum sp.]|nr:hypothetical protein [Arenibaculum sp.]